MAQDHELDDVRRWAVLAGWNLAEDRSLPPYTSQLEPRSSTTWDISQQVDHHRGSPPPPGPWKCERDPQPIR